MRSVLSVILVFTLTLCLCAPASASERAFSILRASERFGEGGYSQNGDARMRGFIEDFGHLSAARPGDEYFLPLRAQDFEWNVERGEQRPTELSSRTAEMYRFGLHLEYEKGREVFDSVALVVRDGSLGVLIDFIDVYRGLEGTRFHVDAYLTSMGSRIEGGEFEIAGEMKNRNRMIYSRVSAVPLGVGRMATGMYDCYDVRFDLGDGVALTGDLLFAEEVYGDASRLLTADDMELRKRYPQIVEAVRLNTINLTGRVSIDTGGRGVLNVYDAGLNLLGTTEDDVRLARVYYLVAGKL